jgi:integrase
MLPSARAAPTSGLGCRIGELLALDWPRVDADAGTLAIEGTVIRVPGSGLIVQDHTKSRAGMRTIMPPRCVMDLLHRRHAGSHGPWVFPSTRGTLRDADTTRQQLRAVLKGTAWQGLHPHAFRTSWPPGSARPGSQRARSRTTSGTSASR